jgi:hypothetical protein
MFWLRIESKLDLIIHMLRRVLRKEDHMGKELDALTAQVTENTNVENSAVQLIQNIAAQLAAAGTDPAKLTALSATLKTSSDALAASITANTPIVPAA